MRCLFKKKLKAFSKNSEDEMQQLSMLADFLVELSEGILAKREAGPSFATFSHREVDFILGDQTRWFSIMNSIMILLFLSGMVAIIMLRTLRRYLRVQPT